MQNEVVSMLPKIITAGFKAIRLIYFFTAGEDEVKCWQIRKGAKAPQVTPLICAQSVYLANLLIYKIQSSWIIIIQSNFP